MKWDFLLPNNFTIQDLTPYTSKNMNEFIDAYSDDETYLNQYEKILRKRRINFTPIKSLYIPMLCRLHIMIFIGIVEVCIKQWMKKNDSDLYDIYFKKRNTSNEQKLSALRKAFSNIGINIKEIILDDFLALKYLRNTIIHAEWYQKQKEYVLSRGFPDNIMNFNNIHLRKIKFITKTISEYQGKFLLKKNV